jgi:predicted GIY-YIG superfamily endonuclease
MAEEIVRIYRLLCEDGYYYIGATTQPLLLRLKNHKHLSKTTLNKIYTHLNEVGWDQISIELVEECLSTEKKDRLQNHIDSHKDDPLCLNYLMLNIYQRGKIYSMTGHDGHYYIGSTTMSLTDRFRHHKEFSKTHDTRVYEYCKRVGWKNITMELLEDYPCDSSEELHEREEYHLAPVREDPLCLNTIRAFLTPEVRKMAVKQYYEENREQITCYQAWYSEENADQIKARRDAYKASHRKELAEKQRAYAKEHQEELRITQKEYRDSHKEELQAYFKKYVGENKEAVAARKSAWAQRKKEETKDERAEQSRIKREAREQKTQQRFTHENTIVTCECGGTYQNYRKKRHDSSALHQRFMETHLRLCVPIPSHGDTSPTPVI